MSYEATALILAAGSMFLSFCLALSVRFLMKGEKGDQGPEGPPGPKGDPGESVYISNHDCMIEDE